MIKTDNHPTSQNIYSDYLSLPNLVKGVTWAGIGYAALQGIKAHNNEGFINHVVFVPIVEEILFRGILQPGIKKVQEFWNRVRGTKMDEISTRNRVLTSSLIFGLSHSTPKDIVKHTWNLGRACGYLQEKTGSLLAPIAMHMGANFIACSQLRRFIPQALFYSPLFYSLGKEILPIPECIRKHLRLAAEKSAKLFNYTRSTSIEPKRTELRRNHYILVK